MTNYNSNEPKQIDYDENGIIVPKPTNMRVSTLKTLMAICIQAKINNYNRVVDYAKYFKTLKKNMIKSQKWGFWNGKQTKVLVEPIMVHSHAKGEKVENHMRCFVRTGNTVMEDVVQDIPMNLFNSLEIALSYYPETLRKKVVDRMGWKESEVSYV